MCVMLLASCGGDNGEEGAGQADTAAASDDLSGQTIHVQYWPTEREWIENLIIKPFEDETGADVVTSFGQTGETVAKVAAQKSSPQLDVILLDDRGAFQLAEQELLNPLSRYDLENVGEIPEKFVLAEGTGAGFAIYDNILLYNTDLFDAPPTSWDVLFDEEYRDMVVLPPIEWGNGLQLLETIARLEGTTMAEDPEQVWTRVEELEPQVQSFLSDFALTAQQFESGDVALSVLQPPVFKQYMDAGAPLAPAWDLPYWGVGVLTAAAVADHPASDELVEAFLNKLLSASVLEPLANDYLYGVTLTSVQPSPEVAEWASFGERLEKTFTLNYELVAEEGDEWAARWNSIFGSG